jgi:hypothetical protein
MRVPKSRDLAQSQLCSRGRTSLRGTKSHHCEYLNNHMTNPFI